MLDEQSRESLFIPVVKYYCDDEFSERSWVTPTLKTNRDALPLRRREPGNSLLLGTIAHSV